ncbi:MAG: hypothetical protein ACLP9Y_22045 [Mycobacterium sp.]
MTGRPSMQGLTTSEAAGFKKLRHWARSYYPHGDVIAQEPASAGTR